MTTTLGFEGIDDEGHKLVRDVEEAALKALRSGKVKSTVNGVASVVHTAETSHGHVQAHPTDASQDQYHPHPDGHRPNAPVSVTFVDAPTT